MDAYCLKLLHIPSIHLTNLRSRLDSYSELFMFTLSTCLIISSVVEVRQPFDFKTRIYTHWAQPWSRPQCCRNLAGAVVTHKEQMYVAVYCLRCGHLVDFSAGAYYVDKDSAK